jgi:hypothetical protein
MWRFAEYRARELQKNFAQSTQAGVPVIIASRITGRLNEISGESRSFFHMT